MGFQADLKWSQAASRDLPWLEIFQARYPNARDYFPAQPDSLAQRGGTDGVLQLNDGTVILVDEKIRGADYGDDVLLEIGHKRYNGTWTEGWVTKEQHSCDLIAYVRKQVKVCYLIPWRELHLAWKRYRPDWTEKYPWRKADNGTYTTYNIAIPVSVLSVAIPGITAVEWE